MYLHGCMPLASHALFYATCFLILDAHRRLLICMALQSVGVGRSYARQILAGIQRQQAANALNNGVTKLHLTLHSWRMCLRRCDHVRSASGEFDSCIHNDKDNN